MMNPIVKIISCLIFLSFSQALLADKSDIIILKNGDHVTGEIKGLISGQLELSTEYMDTVFIDWENIRDIISDQGQQIEMSDGRRLLGTLDKPQTTDPEKANLIIIKTETDKIEADSTNIVRMYPIGGSFWDRMDLNIGLGFDFDKSSSVGKFNLGANATYRAPNFITFGKFSSELTTQEAVDNTKRVVFGIDHMTYLDNRRYRNYFGSIEQNDELGVNLRTLVGVGYGWVPISTGRNWLSWGLGIDANWEKPIDGGDGEVNLEAVGTFRYQYYKHSSPERVLDTYFKVFPSITEWGRVRADFTTNAYWEIINDFTFGLEFYASFDGEPSAPEAAESDYGIRTLIGLKF